MRRYVLQAAEDIWNGLVGGVRQVWGDPFAMSVVACAGVLLWDLVSH